MISRNIQNRHTTTTTIKEYRHKRSSLNATVTTYPLGMCPRRLDLVILYPTKYPVPHNRDVPNKRNAPLEFVQRDTLPLPPNNTTGQAHNAITSRAPEYPSPNIDWIQWFLEADSLEQSFNESRWIDRVIRSSPAENPLLISQVSNGKQSVAGYAILARGALAVHGRLSSRDPAALQHSPCDIVQHLPIRSPQNLTAQNITAQTLTPANPEPPNLEPHQELQAHAIRDLMAQAFAAGAEMYHALETLPSPPYLPTIHPQPHHPVFTQAGLRFVTTLLRLENSKPFSNTANPKTRPTPLRFEPYRNMPFDQWCDLIKSAYKDSLDVPEIEGARSIQQTLQGYSVYQPSHTDAWFSIWLENSPIGSLILSIPNSRQAELTYLGLLPQYRSQGYGSEIMQFVMQWVQQQHIELATLSVDCRNTPALRLYQRFGFQITEAYHAWACTPVWFRETTRTL